MFVSRKTNSNSAQRNLQRTGFSLIEILVVLMVLAILYALISGPMAAMLGIAKGASTQATIEQVGSVIQARYEAVMNADVSAEAKKLAVLNSTLDEADAEYLIRMTLYRQALPQCPEDMSGMDLDGATSGDNAPYAGLWNGPSSSDNTAITASEVFMLALTKGSTVRALPGGKSYPVPLLELDNITQSHVVNLDNDLDTTGAQLSELVDEWGIPFRFYNFPTGLMTVSGSSFDISNAELLISGLPTNLSTTGLLSKDPFDGSGTHYNHLRGEFTNNPTNMQYRTGGGTTTTPVAIMSGAAGLDNYYHSGRTFTPLLVSAGSDLLIGLNEPTAGNSGRLCVVTSSADLTDNLTNRQQ